MFETPILFIIFNRPDTTQQVFDEIKKIKPYYLYVAADGARLDKESDVEKIAQTRAIIEQIDWDCKLKTLFRDENKGCGKGPAEAITWFFQNVEQGIILEDDCVPHPDFFPFCEQMLNEYKDDDRIISITGSNFQDGKKRSKGSYYFSVHNRIWGWASWRRTWQHYDYYLKNIEEPEFNQLLIKLFANEKERQYWDRIYRIIKEDRLNDSAWDYQFMFMQWKLNGLTLTSNVNLISNIGDGEDATHTVNWINNKNLRRKTNSIFPLVINSKIEKNTSADKYYFEKYILNKRSILQKVVSKLRKIFF